MFSQLSSLLSTSVYIGIGSAYKLYQHFYDLENRESLSKSNSSNNNNNKTKLADLNFDCLLRLLEQVPLEQRLFSLRQVNSQWMAVVKTVCQNTKTLTLQLGREHQWSEIARKVKSKHANTRLLVNALNRFHSLTAEYLSEPLTTFLSGGIFPRLKTLAIVVSDPTEDVDYLEHLPRLVTAYASSLTTLQIVFNLPNAPFHAIMTQLAVAIDGLPRLERLSLFDYANCLTMPMPFNLPRLFTSTTFRTFDFCFKRAPTQRADQWVESLRARMIRGQQVNNKPGNKSPPPPPPLMAINMQAHGYIPYRGGADPLLTVAAHFQLFSSVIFQPVSPFTVRHFADAFVNLRAVRLFNTDLPMGAIFVQLTKLPHLFDLYLDSNLPREDDEDGLPAYPDAANSPPPSLPSVGRLALVLHSDEPRAPFEHRFLEELRFEVVFPAVKLLYISLSFGRCTSCEWRPRLPPQNTGQVEQCVRRLVTPFLASPRNRPQLGEVIAHADDRYQLDPLIDFTVHAFEEGPPEQTMVLTNRKGRERGKRTPLL
ncbi:hypothetical protein TYRP_016845 [Tyrophagus putrescentiae]|nr:hypothetical protein TYRP_016845 [Tyrophagus putrescentiae]